MDRGFFNAMEDRGKCLKAFRNIVLNDAGVSVEMYQIPTHVDIKESEEHHKKSNFISLNWPHSVDP